MNKLNAAIQLRVSGQLEEARAILLELAEQHPTDPSVWYQCAWVHDTMGFNLTLDLELTPSEIIELIKRKAGDSKWNM